MIKFILFTSLLFRLSLQTDVDLTTNGLISIHTENLDETFVYINKVTTIHRTIKNGTIIPYVRDYFIESPNEKIILAATNPFKSNSKLCENILIFTKITLPNQEICKIKEIRYFKIYETDFQVNNLCEFLNDAIFVRRYLNSFHFWYKNLLKTYSIINFNIETKSMKTFKNLDINYKYTKFISDQVLEFHYENSIIEYNMNTMEILKKIEYKSKIEETNEENIFTQFYKNKILFTTITIGSILTIVLTITLISLKLFLKADSSVLKFIPQMFKTANTVAQMVEIPMSETKSDEDIHLKNEDEEDQTNPLYYSYDNKPKVYYTYDKDEENPDDDKKSNISKSN